MPTARILVTGASGFLGECAVRALRAAGHDVVTTSRTDPSIGVDLAAEGMVAAVLEAAAPDLVLNLAAMARIDECERRPDAARRLHVDVAEQFAQRFGARLLHVSTDLVFDGRGAPYAEAAAPAPLSVYGVTKSEGEEHVRRHGGRVVRLPLLFGPDHRSRGASASLRRAITAGTRSPMFTNEYRTPLHVVDAAQALAELVMDPDAPAIVHVPGPERVSRWEFARRLCAQHGLDEGLLVPVECQDGLRPRDVSLIGLLPPRRSLDAMLADA